MSTPELGPSAPAAARAELRRSLDLLVDRIRAMPLSRLERAPEGAGTTRAAAVGAAAQRLADLAAAAEGRPRRELPGLATHGLGDQLAVVGGDALTHGAPSADVETVLVGLRRSL
ncbi:hypothetical protein ACFFKU_17765 [Kineococcus gynurae]|uniref:Uncharacterized protein n=1 Tax=Kineococcus gynurae TaxID=452979 RepID=A0ABV5LNK9_9ACTN